MQSNGKINSKTHMITVLQSKTQAMFMQSNGKINSKTYMITVLQSKIQAMEIKNYLSVHL
jgi:hypothetical protein